MYTVLFNTGLGEQGRRRYQVLSKHHKKYKAIAAVVKNCKKLNIEPAYFTHGPLAKHLIIGNSNMAHNVEKDCGIGYRTYPVWPVGMVLIIKRQAL